MAEQSFQDAVITQTVVPEHLLTGMTIGTLQEDYPLCEADYLRLKSNQNPTAAWAVNFFFATVGYGISIAPKWLSELTGKAEKVSQSEWTVLALGIGVSALMYAIGLLLPNERKAAMKKIEDHFKSAPKSRQLIRGKE